MNPQYITLNGANYPIFTDEPAMDVVDQLLFAADEADWSPEDGDINKWAEDTALVFTARQPTDLTLDQERK